ncbi:MAG: preprotein translocase subunit YajC [Alphaproteobacteria bacterium]|nr:preprotein translocase subunit YajC [Alphaproteobacteria bacterium]
MFISPAFAQAAAEAAPQEFSFASFVPLIAIFAIFYLLIIRPQSKKMKEHQEMVNNLKIGNNVVTSGGIVGVVKDVLTKENQIEIEIAEGVRIKLLKQYVSELVKDAEEIKNQKSKIKNA